MKFTLIIISFLCSLNVYSQFTNFGTEIDFKEKQADSLDIRVDSIMILGVGASVTRIFLNDLTDRVKRELNKQNITVSYFFLGQTTEEAKKTFSQLSKQGYKILLFLLPQSSDYFQIENNQSGTNAGGIIITGTSTSMSYLQKFKFQLFKNGVKNERIWYASVSVGCDPGKQSGSKLIAKKLIEHFRKNKYIQ